MAIFQPPPQFRQFGQFGLGRAAGPEGPESTVSEQRGAAMPKGPYIPRPGQRAPHEDIGQFANDLIGDAQSAGETLMQALDQPFQTVGFKGPHRLLDGLADLGSGLYRNLTTLATRWNR